MDTVIKSRVIDCLTTVTVSVKEKTLTSGKHVETNVSGMSSLTATQRRPSAQEIASNAGAIVVSDEIFLFETVSGTLPAILEEYVIVDASSVRYEIKSVRDASAGQGDLLMVVTERGR